MSKLNFILRVSLFASMIFLLPSLAEAQATRTWVSGVGDDANPCSRTAPCKTFQGTISKTAAGGEINCLDPGGFGAVTITKSMTIDCKNVMAGVLAAGTNGIIINAPAGSSVNLRGLELNGFTTGLSGVRILSASTVTIDDLVIYGFATGISIANSIEMDASIKNSVIRNNSGTGIDIAPTTGIPNTSVAIGSSFLENNSIGVSSVANSKTVVTNTSFTHQTTTGLYARKSEVTLNGCTFAHSATGIQVDNLGNIRLNNVTVTNNTTGLSILSSGNIISFKNNTIAGNTTDGAPNITLMQQ